METILFIDTDLIFNPLDKSYTEDNKDRFATTEHIHDLARHIPNLKIVLFNLTKPIHSYSPENIEKFNLLREKYKGSGFSENIFTTLYMDNRKANDTTFEVINNSCMTWLRRSIKSDVMVTFNILTVHALFDWATFKGEF